MLFRMIYGTLLHDDLGGAVLVDFACNKIVRGLSLGVPCTVLSRIDFVVVYFVNQ